jgi:hypothetical protein
MDLGANFARALQAKDAAGLKSVLAPEIDFKAMTPSRFWEAQRADEVVDDIVLRHWFQPTDAIEALEHLETSSVGGRQKVGYRMRVRRGGEVFLVEQQAYFDGTGDRIGWLRIMCSGYQPQP